MIATVEKNQETRLEKVFTFLGRVICALGWSVPLLAMLAGIIWLSSIL